MITKISGGTVVTHGKKFLADVYYEGGKITYVGTDAKPYDKEINAKGAYVCPGFIDIHTHGGAGYDFLDNTVEAYHAIAKAHAEHGTTTLLPTVTSSTTESMLKALKTFKEVKETKYVGANMPGIHFEGPYFAPSQKGAQDEKMLRPFTPEEYNAILAESDDIIRWTGAPELDGAEGFAKALTAKGVLPCIGHSDANSECVAKVKDYGFTHITHLYSATSIVHRKNAYRYGGIVEAAYLYDDITVEIIADGSHLPYDLIRLVYKIKGADNTALITDSIRGAGLPDGIETVLGSMEDGLRVIIEDGVAKLPDRTAFAGSVAFFDRLIRTVVDGAKIPLEDAITMASYAPAKIVGLKEKGELVPEYDADIVILDGDLTVKATIVAGETVYDK